MNGRSAVTTTDVPAASGPYSPAILSQGFAFLSGQGPYDSDGVLAGEGIEAQTRQTLLNLETVARASGAALADAVKIGVYLTDMGNFAAMNKVFAEFFEQPFPARTTVRTGLPTSEMLVEIDAIVALPEAT
ncbi:MAG: RidA family protein [Acidimicrobiaceae bacterium]|nr:RidA family protein [Acidimicrobiaceae bacterium]MCY3948727.1 RidA family protein [Acidimicrobiaceae bacterium]